MKRPFVFIIAVLVLAWPGMVLASNMGFKLNYPLAASSGSSHTNWVSLPYFWSGGATYGATARGVCEDVGANATEVGRYNESSDTFTGYTCGNRGTGFSLTPGQAVYVRVGAATNWIIVGSHNDALSINLASTAGSSHTNWTSIPYHTTAVSAKDVCTQVGANATEVGRYNEVNDTFTGYTCGNRGTGFSLTVGQGVYIRVGTNTAWTPAHY